MDKKLKITIIVIIILAFFGIGVFACNRIYNNSKDENTIKEENVVNEEENTVNENVIEEQVVDDPVIDDEEENKQENNDNSEIVSNTIPDTNYQSQKVYETNDSVGTTDQKEEAINLVKDYWGEDDTVTYRCDSITTSGEYIIAVTSKETATVKGFFRVNLQTKSVTVEF